ncbi:uncharacterized protein BYT42DRAFT_582969 [Radiomyces spectabilis]|uniref:uncharacterized protein n=1 Tax=Radiomyces spectabilis TaxID=64574 RepID=UPI00222124BC|nr:uncharacterized protein BYT42DRAFT_582969 [Radiomyces spectabilis]KAI8370592.1 hypothetical protein BYT42DRAFT_582969 [Radiomyces spectabilis]
MENDITVEEGITRNLKMICKQATGREDKNIEVSLRTCLNNINAAIRNCFFSKPRSCTNY